MALNTNDVNFNNFMTLINSRIRIDDNKMWTYKQVLCKNWSRVHTNNYNINININTHNFENRINNMYNDFITSVLEDIFFSNNECSIIKECWFNVHTNV